MAKTVNNVSFLNSNDPNSLGNAIALQKAQRQIALSELLQKQALEPLGKTEVIGGYAVKKNPLEFLARALQGKWANDQINNSEKSLIESQLAQKKSLGDMILRQLNSGNEQQPSVEPVDPVAPNDMVQAPTVKSNEIQPQDSLLQKSQMDAVDSNNPMAYMNPKLSIPKNVQLARDFQAQMIRDTEGQGNSGSIPSVVDNKGETSGVARGIANNAGIYSKNNALAQIISPQAMPSNDSQVVQQNNTMANILPANQPTQPAQMNNNAVNPLILNALYTNPQDFQSKLLDNYFKDSQLTDVQKNNRYAGITPEQYRKNELALYGKNKAPVEVKDGYSYDPTTGNVSLRAPVTRKANEQYLMPNGQYSEAFVPYKETAQGNYDISKANKAGELSAKFGIGADGKSYAQKESDIKTSETLNNKYVEDYTNMTRSGLEAKQMIPKIVDRLDLINNTKTGLGVPQKNKVAEGLASFGINLKLDNLSNQQILEAELGIELINSTSKLAGAKSDKDIELFKSAIGSLSKNSQALREFSYKKLHDLQQTSRSADVATKNVQEGAGFGRFHEVYNVSPIERDIAIVKSFKGKPILLRQYLDSIPEDRRNIIINGGK